ncbi:hypothetical protein J31TS4_18810 [Paenibacillus sp. J31TS4]|uniref:helix-turn-helix domain-containing protein n=1 Tax=Paenibacillus sp. J31TS4 TaxID=2807195 RepID=UPI001B0BB2EB|nr:helix-turn-helix transcriptional regulator [Paenibacillus sp. J31TS4]GIP38601.1 hypothetical protein J31TS4_18810 [Paenibacillus sp. J31TS4]
MTTNIAEFGWYIRGLREKEGMNLSRLAQLSGVSHPYLSQIENGKLKGFPSPDILKKISGPLGVSPEELMFRAGHIIGSSTGQTAEATGTELLLRAIRKLTAEGKSWGEIGKMALDHAQLVHSMAPQRAPNN